MKNYFGDAYVAQRTKGSGTITTQYGYENTEGLTPDGLWIIEIVFCWGRNLEAPCIRFWKILLQRMYFCLSIASLRAYKKLLGKITAEKNIPTTFFTWGALYGVGENLYDYAVGTS